VKTRPRNPYRSLVFQRAMLRKWLAWLNGGHADLDRAYRETMRGE
jgi:hypothetical protein